MELFRHNHARFIALDITNPNSTLRNMQFNFTSFIDYIKKSWNEKMPGSKNLKIVFFMVYF